MTLKEKSKAPTGEKLLFLLFLVWLAPPGTSGVASAHHVPLHSPTIPALADPASELTQCPQQQETLLEQGCILPKATCLACRC